MGIKDWVKGVKKDFATKKEIESIKKNAYISEMKSQAETMGKRQAEIEAKHREKIFMNKIKTIETKKVASNNAGNKKPIDVFGFNKNSSNKKGFNVITGEYK